MRRKEGVAQHGAAQRQRQHEREGRRHAQDDYQADERPLPSEQALQQAQMSASKHREHNLSAEARVSHVLEAATSPQPQIVERHGQRVKAGHERAPLGRCCEPLVEPQRRERGVPRRDDGESAPAALHVHVDHRHHHENDAETPQVREHQHSGALGRSEPRTRLPLLRFARAPVQEHGLADEEGEQVERGVRNVRRRLEPCRVPRERADVRS
eukprot:1108688-Pleurochrysis_carterae.AAC.1